MVELVIMGRQVLIEGHGTESEPFLVRGIKNDPALAAVAEETMIDHWMGQGNWLLIESKIESTARDCFLAILSIKTFDENDEVVQGKVWFDISEAFERDSMVKQSIN
jgi:hypothetical protein